MLHLIAHVPIKELDLLTGDTLLALSACPGRMARVTIFEGDFSAVAHALETGKLSHVGPPVSCDEVEEFVARALREPPPPPATQPQPRSA